MLEPVTVWGRTRREKKEKRGERRAPCPTRQPRRPLRSTGSLLTVFRVVSPCFSSHRRNSLSPHFLVPSPQPPSPHFFALCSSTLAAAAVTLILPAAQYNVLPPALPPLFPRFTLFSARHFCVLVTCVVSVQPFLPSHPSFPRSLPRPGHRPPSDHTAGP